MCLSSLSSPSSCSKFPGLVLGYLFPRLLEMLRHRLDVQDLNTETGGAVDMHATTESYVVIDCLGDRCVDVCVFVCLSVFV